MLYAYTGMKDRVLQKPLLSLWILKEVLCLLSYLFQHVNQKKKKSSCWNFGLDTINNMAFFHRKILFYLFLVSLFHFNGPVVWSPLNVCLFYVIKSNKCNVLWIVISVGCFAFIVFKQVLRCYPNTYSRTLVATHNFYTIILFPITSSRMCHNRSFCLDIAYLIE